MGAGPVDSNSNIGSFTGSVSTTINTAAAGNDRLVVVHCGLEFTGTTGDTPTNITINGTSIISNLIAASVAATFRACWSYYALESDLPSGAGTYNVTATFSGGVHTNKEVEAIAVEYYEGIDQAAGLITSGTGSSSSKVGAGGVSLTATSTDYVMVAAVLSGGTAALTWGNPTGVVKSEETFNAEGGISAAHDLGTSASSQTIDWTVSPTIRYGMTAGIFDFVSSLSATVGQASETDSAQAITPAPDSVTVAVGQATETDTAQAITPETAQNVAVGQSTETDSALTITPAPDSVSVNVGQASETDSAQAITAAPGALSVSVGQSSETDSALSVTAAPDSVAVAVGQASETDSALAITAVSGTQNAAVNQATETDSALAITANPDTVSVSVGQATETDSALPIAATFGAVTVGQASEADSALAITAAADSVSVAVGQASETDSALAIAAVSGAGTIAIGQTTEADSALAITPAPDSVSVAVGQATETDSALSITAAFGFVAVGQASETDSALSITPAPDSVSVSVGQAVETDSALPISIAGLTQTVVLNQGIETDSALSITPFVGVSLGQAIETDEALPIQAIAPRLFAFPQEQQFNALSILRPLWKLYFYEVGTDTIRPVYADSSLSIQHSSPVVLDRFATFPTVYIETPTPYKIEVRDEFNNLRHEIGYFAYPNFTQKLGMVGQVEETDSALPITPAMVVPVSQAVETNSALAIAAV